MKALKGPHHYLYFMLHLLKSNKAINAVLYNMTISLASASKNKVCEG